MKMRLVIKYLLSALLLLGANSSFGALYWQTSTSGGVFGIGSSPSSAATDFCSKRNGCTSATVVGCESFYGDGVTCERYAIQWETEFSTSTQYANVSDFDAACPLPLVDDGNGQCIDEPVCPEHQIQTTENGQNICINKCDVVDINGNPRVASFSFALGSSTPTLVDDGLGCEYSRQSVESCTLNPETEIATCFYSYAETGNYVGVDSSTDAINEDPVPPQVDIDTTDDSVTQNTDATPTVTNPDGSTTDVVTESKVVTSGSGSKIWDDNDNIYVQNSTGSVTQYDKTVTSVTNPDGSVTEVISIAGTTATPNVTNNIISKNTGTGSSATTNSTIINNSSTTTNVYNSNGGLVSSGTISNGSGTGTGTDDKTVEGNCGAPDQPSCEVTLKGDGEFEDPSDIFTTSGVIQALDDAISGVQDTGTETNSNFSAPFTFNLYSGGGCDPTSFGTTYKGEQFQLLERYCPVHESYVRPALNWAFYMLTLIGIYSIFIHTFRKK